jgi:RimJ/RimL family protein N-acetyltransferase
MPENSDGDPAKGYEMESCAPADLAGAELAACLAIIERGEAVDMESAAEELPRAAVLSIARTGDKIAGVGAIKRVRAAYAARIAQRSEAAFDPATPELGYVAVDGGHGNRGLSRRIVAALLSQHNGRLFATTDNEYMKRTLDKAGFVRKGREWTGQRGRLSLWIRERQPQ